MPLRGSARVNPPRSYGLPAGNQDRPRRSSRTTTSPGPIREKTRKTMTAATYPHVDLNDNSLTGARAWFAQRGLSRPREGRVLAGVAAAFARRYDINPLVARLGTIATILV